MTPRKSRNLSRRRFLKGASATLALPLLGDWSRSFIAADDEAGDPRRPRRLLFVYAPNGKHMPDWTPKAAGAEFELPYLLEPLSPYRDQLRVLSGLALDGARPKGDGPGDHARATAAFLTCAHPRKTDGADIRAAISVDQVAASSKLGSQTRLPSLELGIEASKQAGDCDSGYSCIYSSNISWRGPSTPTAKEIHPRLVFERLFGDSGSARNTPEERARRARYRSSVLDLVRDQARDLSRELSGTDRTKIEEYESSLRDVELRLEKIEKDGDAALPPGATEPPPTPGDVREHIRLMFDLVILAFQTDSTRVATLMLGNAGSNRSYRLLGVPDGHHDISHHGNDPKKLAGIKKINRFHTEEFARFLGRLAAVREGDGTLLDSTLVVYGSGIADGDRHDHEDLPIVLAGGQRVSGGRHIRSPDETPIANLYVSLLAAVGVHVRSFGDSTGPLTSLGV